MGVCLCSLCLFVSVSMFGFMPRFVCVCTCRFDSTLVCEHVLVCANVCVWRVDMCVSVYVANARAAELFGGIVRLVNVFGCVCDCVVDVCLLMSFGSIVCMIYVCMCAFVRSCIGLNIFFGKM